jgi:hypothetical protein
MRWGNCPPSEFIQRIFGIGACLVTDESSLWDFQSEADGETKDEIIERIREAYGVNVADIEHGNLVAVLNRIRQCA